MKYLFGIVAALASVTLLAAGAWFTWIHFVNPVYRSEARLDLADSLRKVHLGDPLIDTLVTQPLPVERLARNHAEALRTEELLRNVVQWPPVKNSDWLTDFNGDIRGAADELARRIDAYLVPGTSLLNIAVTSPYPDEADELLDSLLTRYLQNQTVRTENQAATITAKLTRDRERATETLRRLEMERDRFVHENDLAGRVVSAPSLNWVHERLIDAEISRHAPKDGADPTDTSEDENTAKIDHWREAVEATHLRHRDHFQKMGMYESITAAIRRARDDIDSADKALTALRRWQSMDAAVGITRAEPPTEPVRVWWRWPWN